MEIETGRREFLVAAGAAALGASAPAWGREPSIGRAFRPPSDGTRRELIGRARFGPKSAARGKRGVAVSTHPLATDAALQMLRAGGNAADAICAAALTQTVVEPHMTTLSGVFSLLYYDARSKKLSYLNCSNNAPLKTPADFVPAKAGDFLADGRGVTTPGYWAGIETTLKAWGKLGAKDVLAPAIHYAREGFEIHPFLWGEMFLQMDLIAATPQGREIYYPKGVLLQPGDRLVQKRAADLLERLGEEGSGYFYRGDFARNFSTVVQNAGGWITPEDFARYEPRWAEPVRGKYRNYDLVAAPSPDYGGNNFVEIMNVMSLVDLQKMGPAFNSPETAALIRRVLGEVFTDAIKRNTGVLAQTNEEALTLAVAEARLAKVRSTTATRADYTVGAPPGSNQVTVVDADGNVATLLHSCMSQPWCNGLFVDGISICGAGAHYRSGLPRPGERIWARILPMMALHDNRPVLAAGSPSISLTDNVIQNTINILDFGLPIAESVMKPRFGGDSPRRQGRTMVEEDMGPRYIAALEKLGVPVDVTGKWFWNMGSFDGVAIDANGTASACGDPRRTAMAGAL